MTQSSDVKAELLSRIDDDRAHFAGELPPLAVAAWRGYLAALLEWGLLSITAYDDLVARLPALSADPAVAILAGRAGR